MFSLADCASLLLLRASTTQSAQNKRLTAAVSDIRTKLLKAQKRAASKKKRTKCITHRLANMEACLQLLDVQTNEGAGHAKSNRKAKLRTASSKEEPPKKSSKASKRSTSKKKSRRRKSAPSAALSDLIVPSDTPPPRSKSKAKTKKRRKKQEKTPSEDDEAVEGTDEAGTDNAAEAGSEVIDADGWSNTEKYLLNEACTGKLPGIHPGLPNYWGTISRYISSNANAERPRLPIECQVKWQSRFKSPVVSRKKSSRSKGSVPASSDGSDSQAVLEVRLHIVGSIFRCTSCFDISFTPFRPCASRSWQASELPSGHSKYGRTSMREIKSTRTIFLPQPPGNRTLHLLPKSRSRATR